MNNLFDEYKEVYTDVLTKEKMTKWEKDKLKKRQNDRGTELQC